MKSANLVTATALFATLAFAPGAEAQVSGLVGNWVHEGTQQELVIRSSIQTRTYSMPGDFSFGGSTPNTYISTTPTPTQVHRQMALIIREDGRFSWVTQKSYPESASCQVDVFQDKVGDMSLSGSRATLNISRGSERASRSCNDNVAESDRSNRSETYTITRSGRNLRVSDGTVTWTFVPYQQ